MNIKRLRLTIKMQKAKIAALYLLGKADEAKRVKALLRDNLNELKAMREFVR